MRVNALVLVVPLLLTVLACDPKEQGDGDGDGDEPGDGDGDGDEQGDGDGDEPSECAPIDEPQIGTFTISTNAEAAALAGATAVQGNISIIGEVTDLSALACLTEVSGAIWIVETSVPSLEPLAQLVHVGGELEIGYAPAITQVVLPNLEHVGYLSVYANELLTHLALPKLATIEQNAEIEGNLGLPTCEITAIRDALSSIGGTFWIVDNLPDGCDG
jgi:hypothetical protein